MIDLNQFMRRTQADELYVKKDEVDELLKGSMQSVTYAELKALRDNGQLVAGRQYRITDYVTTTTQENTRSAGHPFDIIVTADSESVLNENARAIQHEEEIEEDEPEVSGPPVFKPEITVNDDGTLPEGAVIKYYTIMDDIGSSGANAEYKSGDIFVEYGYAENNLGDTVPVLYKTDESYLDEGADYDDVFFYVGKYEYNGTTYDRWRKIEEGSSTSLFWDGSSKVHVLTNVIVDGDYAAGKEPPYFAESNLAAWQLKYCLDNDTKRFAWAQKDKTTQAIINAESRFSNGKPLLRVPRVDGQNVAVGYEKYQYGWGVPADSGGGDVVYSQNEILLNNEVVYDAWGEQLLTAEVVDLGIYTDDEEWFICTGTLEHEGVTYYKWECLNKNWVADSGYAERYLLSKTEELSVDEGLHHLAIDTNGDVLEFEQDYSTVMETGSQPEGKGVIYFMRDEWGNECHYDFKNIIYGSYHTFTYNGKDGSLNGESTQNVIGSYFVDDVQYINCVNIGYKSKCVTMENGVAYFYLDIEDGDCLQNVRICSGVAGQSGNDYYVYVYGDRPFETKYTTSGSREVILDEI